VDARITPVPSDDEAAAVMAAVEALWPRPTVVVHADADRSLAWRFSGRWWLRDRLTPADRPWS
jgi:hypothetical protein